ncbi:MAG: diguanylate cyclase [Chloroflexi bacterium]|nr:diguanylate cyclase [Chloroflexota bacterium]
MNPTASSIESQPPPPSVPAATAQPASASSRQPSLALAVERALSRILVPPRRDPPLLLALAIAAGGVLIELIAAPTGSRAWLLLPVAFVLSQLLLASIRRVPAGLASVRLALSLAFVVALNLLIGQGAPSPVAALIIPIVAMAAATRGRAGMVVAVAGIALSFVAVVNPFYPDDVRQRHLAVGVAEIVLAIGSRKLVGNLERAADRLRRANARERRTARRLAAVESVGRLLAVDGPTPDALDRMMGLLEETFGYRYPSVYLWDGGALQLGAQRNYRNPIETIPSDRGVLGRVARTHEPAFLPDVSTDPDFLSADSAVRSEIAIPLLSGEDLLGVLNVESSGARLDLNDSGMLQIVGDRLAVALALGRERQALAERAELLGRLATFSATLNSTLDPAAVLQAVADGAVEVIAAGGFILVTSEAGGEGFRVTALHGHDQRVLGAPIVPGEGFTGRAIAERQAIVEEHLVHAQFAPTAQASTDVPAVAGMAVPLVRRDEGVGAIAWFRDPADPGFSSQEQDVAQLVASQVSLALANARLHQLTVDASITDPLTGLHNRRYFDASLVRADMLRARVPSERREARSAVLFDLDHFGQVNKRHGHHVGDRVLRLFADTLRGRVRGSDLIARYGGEEFVVILEGASRDDAVRIADEVRATFRTQSVETPDGLRLVTTVSAGCASLESDEVAGAQLLERADVALAMAKAGGRDMVVAA